MTKVSFDLSGRVALVTGSTSGLGSRYAEGLAEAGAAVVLNGTNTGRLAASAASLRSRGYTVHEAPFDVTDEAAVKAMVEATVSHFGRLDFAFNSAGISGSATPDEFWDSAIFNETFAINCHGTFYCMKHEVAQMLKQGTGGAIVNVSSVAGLSGTGHPSYNGSKHAVIGLTKTVAIAHATQGIRVNAICPGAIDTPMVQQVTERNPANAKLIAKLHPMQRIGQPNEVADAVLFLCSSRASFITGHPLAVDGGTLAR